MENFEQTSSGAHSVEPVVIPRGVSAPILLNHIRNTAPFLLGENPLPTATSKCFRVLQKLEKNDSISLTHDEYFEMCVSAHFATVGTFVPTDVDNQIRFRLWHPTLDGEIVEKMAVTVQESYFWDITPVTTRYVVSPKKGDLLSGHNGEWFSIAVGAYGATRKRNPRLANDLSQRIICEIEREGRILNELIEAQNGKGILSASMLISHNLGDLNRVLEMWGIVEGDPLFNAAQRTTDKKYCDGAFFAAAELNRNYMALENHRHFTLRSPKALRRSADLLLPLGPYFDAWGKNLVKSGHLSPEEIGTVTEALIDGWNKLLPGTVGYGRAIAGIEEGLGGPRELAKLLPSRLAKQMQTGKLRMVISVPQDKFEGQWNNIALKWIKTNLTYH